MPAELLRKEPSMTIENYGSIVRFTLPPGWTEEPVDDDESAMDSCRVFRPGTEKSEVGIYIVTRGRPATPTDAAAFRAVLIKPPHQVTPSEAQLLERMLGWISNPDAFARLSIFTRMISGKTVLEVQGRWVATECDDLRYYVDTARDGAWIEEIYYTAPKDLFPRYLLAAKEALKSLVLR